MSLPRVRIVVDYIAGVAALVPSLTSHVSELKAELALLDQEREYNYGQLFSDEYSYSRRLSEPTPAASAPASETRARTEENDLPIRIALMLNAARITAMREALAMIPCGEGHCDTHRRSIEALLASAERAQ